MALVEQDWVAVLQEYASAKFIRHEFKEEFVTRMDKQQKITACRVNFLILDENRQILGTLMGHGKAAKKEQAKQMAYKAVFLKRQQLEQHEKMLSDVMNNNNAQVPPPAQNANDLGEEPDEGHPYVERPQEEQSCNKKCCY